jgi:hypothetical protein
MRRFDLPAFPPGMHPTIVIELRRQQAVGPAFLKPIISAINEIDARLMGLENPIKRIDRAALAQIGIQAFPRDGQIVLRIGSTEAVLSNEQAFSLAALLGQLGADSK